MSFHDWVVESRRRYRRQPPWTATYRSAAAFWRGMFRHAGRHIGRSIWARTDPEWDILVVLDACRHDVWDSVAPEYGLPAGRHVWSNASCSIDWINRNLRDGPRDEIRRTGYVTANPFADHNTQTARSADLSQQPLGYLRLLYRDEWRELADGQIATVPPGRVTAHAIKAWRHRDQLDIDRLIVHYMQPHEPYRSRPEWGSGDSKLLENLIDDAKDAGSSIWPALEAGEIPRDEFMAVYRDNLRWVLDDVTGRLLENVDGRVVLTSDHGNAMGEWGEWHHPPGAIGPAVRKVPWSSVSASDGGTVTPTATLHPGDAGTDMGGVDARLEALGYR